MMTYQLLNLVLLLCSDVTTYKAVCIDEAVRCAEDHRKGNHYSVSVRRCFTLKQNGDLATSLNEPIDKAKDYK